ncbi:hypothetical protein [Actinoplanes sp. TFC3]|uniref:hypothetical protein n=1 Tax=Actinoplanes sp. TFC3 TaxID=1710355 RepID=UPI000829D987|nr:hypothetical protein [Actinoplanes sp. TFC3]
MDELDRLLAETMHDAASRAPAADRLLSTVHHRSDRLRRRRLATGLAAVAAVLAVGIPAAGALVARAPTDNAPVAGSIQLVGTYPAPVFPYTLPATDGLSAPVASMRDGALSAFFEATELQQHSDITVTVTSSEPASTAAATEKTVRVRGHSATLRTVKVQPAKQLILTWQESPGRWIRLATDDTYSQQQVIAFAEALTPASVEVLPPFQLDLSPAGFTLDTVTASTMRFRTSPAAPPITVVLRKRYQLDGSNRNVGSYRALLATGTGGTKLSIDVTDWNATLEVSVGTGLALSDADLIRFAAGIHILNRSDPQ